MSQNKPTSTWMGITAVNAYLTRTGDIEAMQDNPFFSLARASIIYRTIGLKLMCQKNSKHDKRGFQEN